MALLEKLFPLSLDYFSILFHQSPDNQHLMPLEASVVNFPYFWHYIEFGLMPVFHDVDMNRLMIIRKELEDKTETNKYRRHAKICINS